jgi:hypothetical protein
MTRSHLLADVAAAVATEKSDRNAQHQTNKQELLSFQLLPKKLVEPTKMTPRDKGEDQVLFQHLVQCRATECLGEMSTLCHPRTWILRSRQTKHRLC